MDRFTRLSRKFGLSSNRPGDSQTEKEHSSSEKEQTEEPFQPTIQIQRKLVIVGNAGCGKTCLLSRFHKNEFPEKFVPSVYESCGVQEISEGSGPTVYLQLWDTSSQDCYERLRPLSYTQTDVVLICFAIDDRESLKTVEEYWMPEIHHFLPKITKILVGCKSDLRQKSVSEKYSPMQDTMVSREQAEQMAERLSMHYFECSAKTNMNVHELLGTALVTARRHKRTRSRCKGCLIL